MSPYTNLSSNRIQHDKIYKTVSLFRQNLICGVPVWYRLMLSFINLSFKLFFQRRRGIRKLLSSSSHFFFTIPFSSLAQTQILLSYFPFIPSSSFLVFLALSHSSHFPFPSPPGAHSCSLPDEGNIFSFSHLTNTHNFSNIALPASS